jgi:hypothetical protein
MGPAGAAAAVARAREDMWGIPARRPRCGRGGELGSERRGARVQLESGGGAGRGGAPRARRGAACHRQSQRKESVLRLRPRECVGCAAVVGRSLGVGGPWGWRSGRGSVEAGPRDAIIFCFGAQGGKKGAARARGMVRARECGWVRGQGGAPESGCRKATLRVSGRPGQCGRARGSWGGRRRAAGTREAQCRVGAEGGGAGRQCAARAVARAVRGSVGQCRAMRGGARRQRRAGQGSVPAAARRAQRRGRALERQARPKHCAAPDSQTAVATTTAAMTRAASRMHAFRLQPWRLRRGGRAWGGGGVSGRAAAGKHVFRAARRQAGARCPSPARTRGSRGARGRAAGAPGRGPRRRSPNPSCRGTARPRGGGVSAARG